MKKRRQRRGGPGFWDSEYKDGGHLALSTNVSEDLEKFTRWLERASGRTFLNPLASVLDLGCGNGRNLIYLHDTFGMRGVGYDISREAITQAVKASVGKPLTYEARGIAGPITLPDNSQTIVLDMMTSHFLVKEERRALRLEILRVLKPGGWLFLKTFLLDEDRHAIRLLKENPAPEAGSYIHPEIGVPEHVFTQQEIVEELEEAFFTVHKIHKSHRHIGPQAKRRSICLYAEKAG